MKKIIIICFSILALFANWAAASVPDKKAGTEYSKNASSATFEYVYYASSSESDLNISKSDVKIFGSRVATVISMIDKACLRYSETDYSVDIYKPVLYDTFCKIINFYKKKIKKKQCTKEQVENELYEVLFKGYVSISNDSSALEREIEDAGSVDEAIEIIRNRVTVSMI